MHDFNHNDVRELQLYLYMYSAMVSNAKQLLLVNTQVIV